MAIPTKLINNTMLHMQNGVPLADLDLTEGQRNRIARVEHVYWQWFKNPYLEPFEMLRQMTKGRGCDAPSELRMAQRDKLLFDFVVEHFSPPSRKISEARVRAAGNRLMRMGMETDNGKDIEAGAKILMKVDRLDQPESEQADLSRTVFLPPVVTTVASEVDPTKEDLNDQQSLDIMHKYGGYIDEKRTLVEEKVAVMEAVSGTTEKENIDE